MSTAEHLDDKLPGEIMKRMLELDGFLPSGKRRKPGHCQMVKPASEAVINFTLSSCLGRKQLDGLCAVLGWTRQRYAELKRAAASGGMAS